MQREKTIILFDGVCNLCNELVIFLIKRDKKAQFKFAALQSEAGKNCLNQFGISTEINSVIVFYKGNSYSQSAAILLIFKQLGGFYSLLYFFILVPPFIRNKIYQIVAKYRFKLFGKRTTCMVPTPELIDRFLI